MATHSCLENSMDTGAWQATVRGVTKSYTQKIREESRVGKAKKSIQKTFSCFAGGAGRVFSRQLYWPPPLCPLHPRTMATFAPPSVDVCSPSVLSLHSVFGGSPDWYVTDRVFQESQDLEGPSARLTQELLPGSTAVMATGYGASHQRKAYARGIPPLLPLERGQAKLTVGTPAFPSA